MCAVSKTLSNQKLKIKFVAKKVEAEPVTPTCTKKYGMLNMIDVHKVKRQKLEHSIAPLCATILKELMTHPAGWLFNQPVDPVVLNIPDYFSIISEPMDLGTIKSKLEKSMYLAAEEFAADVRLTFSNAMLYNPPANNVHQMAKKLNYLFDSRWKNVEVNSSGRSKGDAGWILSENRGRTTNSSMQGNRILSLHANSLSSDDKKKVRQEHVVVSRAKEMPQTVDKLKEGSLMISCDAIAKKVGCTKMTQNTKTKSKKDLEKGIDTNKAYACGSRNAKLPLSLQNGSSNGCSSDLSVERSSINDYCVHSSNGSGLVKNTISHMSKSDLDSNGAVTKVNDKRIHTSFHPTTAAASPDEGWTTPIIDVQLSPKKALRAEMLKGRFADTILKAQQKMLLDPGVKADLVEMQHEKEILQKKHRKEQARLEAQIRGTEAEQARLEAQIRGTEAALLMREAELKLLRQKEREAARVALDEMRRTVEFNDGLQIAIEVEKRFGCVMMRQLSCQSSGKSPLEQLGLYMKDDLLVEGEILGEEREEGEILCWN